MVSWDKREAARLVKSDVLHSVIIALAMLFGMAIAVYGQSDSTKTGDRRQISLGLFGGIGPTLETVRDVLPENLNSCAPLRRTYGNNWDWGFLGEVALTTSLALQ